MIRIAVEPGVWDIARICRRHRWASLPCVEEDRVNDPELCPTCEALADERSLERFIEHRDAGRIEEAE